MAQLSMAQCHRPGHNGLSTEWPSQHSDRPLLWHTTVPPAQPPHPGLSTTQPLLSKSFIAISQSPTVGFPGSTGPKEVGGMPDPAQHQDQFLEQENNQQGGGTPQTPPLDTDSVDPQWLDILPIGMALPRTKIRAQLPRKSLSKGVEP